jgi:hypothetical protein
MTSTEQLLYFHRVKDKNSKMCILWKEQLKERKWQFIGYFENNTIFEKNCKCLRQFKLSRNYWNSSSYEGWLIPRK